MKLRTLPTLAMLLSGALLLSACTESDSTPPAASPSATTPAPVPEPEPSSSVQEVAVEQESVNGPWVQDFWLYDQLQTVNARGELVDLSAQVVTGLGTPSRTHELPFDALFHVFDSLQPQILGADGTPRADVDVLAGLLEHEGVRGLAVLATPHADASAPVGLQDRVELDLTYLGDLLAPDDPLLLDFAFLQARPTPGESPLAGVELFADRLANNGAYYLGGLDDDGEADVYTYSNILTTAMAGSTKLNAPAKPNISDPTLGGINDGLRGCLGKTPLKCLRGYFKKTGDGFRKSNELMRCNLNPNCHEPKTPNLPLRNPPQHDPLPNTPPGRVQGDPHILSFDGHSSSMQGVGEYILTTSDALEVQIRTAPINESSRFVSAVSMVGIRMGNQTAAISAKHGIMSVWIDGELLESNSATGEATGVEFGAGTLATRHGAVVISAPDEGIAVLITNAFGPWLDVSIYLPEGLPGVNGLLGNYDGDPANDLQTRGGQIIDLAADEATYYADFADSWRITQAESLLHYEAGESTETFTDLSFPDATPAPSAEALERGRVLCQAAGVTDEMLLSQCAFDYAMSGAVGFVQSAQLSDSDRERASDLLESAASNFEGEKIITATGVELERTDPSIDAWAFNTEGYPADRNLLHHCTPGGMERPIWGGTDGVYSSDSSVCTAAVHSGLMTFAEGGDIRVVTLPGQADYGESLTQNGVTSRAWHDAWQGSFVLER